MHSEALLGLLGEIPGTEVSAEAGVVTVHVPAIGDSARLAMRDILGWQQIVVPTGDPGVELGVRRGHEELPLIVTVDDMAFMPAYAADMLVPGAEVRVPATPDLIAYSEMHRDVRALGRAVDQEGVEFEDDILAATLLVHRCFLAGAVRVGRQAAAGPVPRGPDVGPADGGGRRGAPAQHPRDRPGLIRPSRCAPRPPGAGRSRREHPRP
jgi:hypothetical protein